MKKRVLVTGGAGFIGSFIVDELVKKGHAVRIFDNLTEQVHKNSQKPGYLNKEGEFIKGDVKKIDELRKAIQDIDVIFHEAAAVGVGQSMYEIEEYVGSNIMGTANLLHLLANTEHDVKKVLVAASMSSYGEGSYKCDECGDVYPELRTEKQMQTGEWELKCPKCGKTAKPVPTPETKKQDCNSIYAITKKNQEEMVLNVGKAYGIPSVALRYFNVYGPRQSLSNPYTGVAAIFMSRIKNKKQPVVYEDGLQTRDFISVRDIADANIAAMESSSADYETFNVGTQRPISIKQVAEILAKLYKEDIKTNITNKFRKGDVRHCISDISRIKSKLGWKPKISFEQGMKELIEWSKDQEAEDKFEKAAEELKQRGLV